MHSSHDGPLPHSSYPLAFHIRHQSLRASATAAIARRRRPATILQQARSVDAIAHVLPALILPRHTDVHDRPEDKTEGCPQLQMIALPSHPPSPRLEA